MHLRRVRWHCPREGRETQTDVLLDETKTTISKGDREVAYRVNQGSSSFRQAAATLRHTATGPSSREDFFIPVHATAAPYQFSFPEAVV
jgi:hypothetical protein